MVADKVLLLVGDSLRADSFKRYAPLGDDYKELVPAYTQTPGATFSLLYGRHLSQVYWPTELNPLEVLRAFNVNPDWPATSTFGMFNFIPLVARILKGESVVHALRKKGIKTMVYSQLNSPPLSLPDFDVTDLPDVRATLHKLDPINRALLKLILRFSQHVFKNSQINMSFMVTNFLLDTIPWREWIISNLGNFYSRHLYEDLANVALRKLKKLEGRWFVYFHAFTPHGEYSCGRYRHAVWLHSFLWNFNSMLAEHYKISQVSNLEELKERPELCEKVKDLFEREVFGQLKGAYEECAKTFADFVKRVKEELVPEGWKVLVTSDHPEYFGEECLSGHPPLPPTKEPPLKVPLALFGEGDLKDVKSYVQIPELVAKNFTADWEAPIKDDVLVSIPYLHKEGWGILVEVTDGKEVAYHAVDERGNEVWEGPEHLREKIKEHERAASSERRKIIFRIRTGIKVRKRVLHK